MMTKLNELKEKYHGGYVTTEFFLSINETPNDTCPYIDEAITGIEKALKELDGEDIGDIKYWVNYHLSGLDRVLEDARENVIKIREWGQKYKDELKRLIELGAHKYY